MDRFPFRCARSFSFSRSPFKHCVCVCIKWQFFQWEKPCTQIIVGSTVYKRRSKCTRTHHSHQTTTADDGRNIDFEKCWQLLNIANFKLITAKEFSPSLSFSLSLCPSNIKKWSPVSLQLSSFCRFVEPFCMWFLFSLLLGFESPFLYYIDRHCITCSTIRILLERVVQRPAGQIKAEWNMAE